MLLRRFLPRSKINTKTPLPHKAMPKKSPKIIDAKQKQQATIFHKNLFITTAAFCTMALIADDAKNPSITNKKHDNPDSYKKIFGSLVDNGEYMSIDKILLHCLPKKILEMKYEDMTLEKAIQSDDSLCLHDYVIKNIIPCLNEDEFSNLVFHIFSSSNIHYGKACIAEINRRHNKKLDDQLKSVWQLNMAVIYGSEEMVDLLVKSTDISAPRDMAYALNIALERSSVPISQLLLKSFHNNNLYDVGQMLCRIPLKLEDDPKKRLLQNEIIKLIMNTNGLKQAMTFFPLNNGMFDLEYVSAAIPAIKDLIHRKCYFDVISLQEKLGYISPEYPTDWRGVRLFLQTLQNAKFSGGIVTSCIKNSAMRNNKKMVEILLKSMIANDQIPWLMFSLFLHVDSPGNDAYNNAIDLIHNVYKEIDPQYASLTNNPATDPTQIDSTLESNSTSCEPIMVEQTPRKPGL